MKISKKALLSLAGSTAMAFAVVVIPFGTAAAVSGGLTGGISEANPNPGTNTTLFGPDSIFTTIVNVLLYLIGAISVIMLIIGGVRYTISAGDSGNVTAAKNTIMYAIIGLVIAFLAYA